MWYAISIGSGLLLGLGLMIWGLAERAARHRAERAADEANNLAAAADRLAKSNAVVAENNGKLLQAEYDRNAVLRAALEEARDRLLKCDDPKTVHEWLTEELKKETVG
jgi:Flp pilus assembly protein TadG